MDPVLSLPWACQQPEIVHFKFSILLKQIAKQKRKLDTEAKFRINSLILYQSKSVHFEAIHKLMK